MQKKIIAFGLAMFTMCSGQAFANGNVRSPAPNMNPVIGNAMVTLPVPSIVTQIQQTPVVVTQEMAPPVPEAVKIATELKENPVEGTGNWFTYASKGTQTSIPALMYHKVTDNPAEVTPYVVTGEMLAADFAEIKARGYTPITVSEYYAMCNLAKNLYTNDNYKVVGEFFAKNPKPIIITFDDGYKGIYTHALPLMKEYGFKVNFYICGGLIDAKNPEYCTWEEVKALADSGLAEIGNHTYSLHNMSKNDLAAAYQKNFDAVLADINKNRDVIAANTGVVSNVYSFPYGQYDYTTIFRLRNAGYQIFISTDYRVNRINDKRDALGRYNRDTEYTSKQFFDIIDAK